MGSGGEGVSRDVWSGVCKVLLGDDRWGGAGAGEGGRSLEEVL